MKVGTISLSAIRSELLQSELPINQRNEELLLRTNQWLSEAFSSQIADPKGIALIAVGGLGRNEITFGSDLDLVLLHDDKSAREAAKLAEKIWYPIWDSGVGLDHSVRTTNQTLAIAQTDIRVMFGLLDQKVIAGDFELAAHLQEQTFATWRKSFFKFLPEIIKKDQQRHDSFGDLAHLQIPNLKESKGGLRDLVTLNAFSKSWQVEVGLAKLSSAKETLWQARTALHVATGKGIDLLSQDLQIDVAKLLEYETSDELLSEIYRAARTISFHYQSAIRAALDLDKSKSWSIKRKVSRSPISDGVVLDGNQIRLALNSSPNHALMMRVAVACAQFDLPINQDTLQELMNSEPVFNWDQRKRELFIEFLASGEPLINAWEALDQVGIISMLMPQWNAIRFAPQRNSVHRFTVDRHLVQTVVEASKLTTLVSRPDILLVAALLHDIGKARLVDHSELGAKIAHEVTSAMGFSKPDQELIVWLVRYHLLLPETATKRDLDDPATLAFVTSIVESQSSLDLLHQLTIADALATSAIAASAWRLNLISQLVSLTRKALKGELMPVELEIKSDLILNSHGVGLEVVQTNDEIIIRVSVPDSPGVLAKVAGFFSLQRLAVRSAKTKTIGDRAISQWQVLPLFGEVSGSDLLLSELTRVITGSVDIANQLAQREQSQLQKPQVIAPTRVLFPLVDSKYTVIEIRAHDRPALLYRITSTLSAQGVDIAAAIVATQGATVDDVFYVQSQSGNPLSEAERDQIGQAILAALAIG